MAAPTSVPVPLITNASSRPGSIALDGSWAHLIDPYRTGELDLWGGENTRGWHRGHRPRRAADGSVLPTDRVEYDFEAATTLEVPGSWVGQRVELTHYEGAVWYDHSFAHEPDRDGRAFLRFGSVNHDARVWCNGVEVGRHVGGYGPFDLEVTEALRPGSDQRVTVRVEAERRADRIPGLNTDWANDGGITGSVHLVPVPTTFLRTAWVQLDPSGARLLGEIVVDGADAAGATVDLDIGGGWSITLEAGPDGIARLDTPAPADLERWRPGAAVLHEVTWRLRVGDRELDVLTDRVGFRTVRTEGARILVNDEPVFLRGIAIHADAPGRNDRACRPEDAATLLDWAQSLGVNFVRLSHYQHPEHMVRECDRRGLLAWCELPVYWGIAWDDDAVLTNATSQLDELIVRDRNRASAILWSVANETMPDEGRNRFLRRLIGRARELDPTRLVAAALFVTPQGDGHHLDDPIAADLDVVGANNYFAWYYGDVETTPTIGWSQDVERPLIMTEYGAGALAGNHGHDRARWTEEFQAAVYTAQYEMQRAIPFLAGTTPWILKDFRTPKRQLPGIQDGWNRKGLFGPDGEEKLAARVVRDAYANWPDP